jgi:ABC-type transport system involved in multi-copper enzyme maturation permease subunit
MKRFIKLFLLLCSWALVAIATATILMLVSEWIAGSTESVLFSAVFLALTILVCAAILAISGADI